MQFFIYAGAANTIARDLMRKITPEIDNAPLDLFDSLEGLIHHLRNPIATSLVAILWPQNNAELATLISRRHLLRNMWIILILPNRDRKTISDSHILRPRYVSHADGNLSDVAAVAGKMARAEKTYFTACRTPNVLVMGHS